MSSTRNRYTYDAVAASVETHLVTPEVSMSRQEFKDDADINVLVRRFGVTGGMPDPAPLEAYGDFSEIGDFHSAMNELLSADSQFMGLPSHIRERFANDPGQLLMFLGNEDNRDEAVELGLIPAPVAPEPPAPEVPPQEGPVDPPSS